MRRAWEIEASERIVLECGCGEELSLADRVERGPGVADLLRGPAFLDGR